jgi:hypothetical protein
LKQSRNTLAPEYGRESATQLAPGRRDATTSGVVVFAKSRTPFPPCRQSSHSFDEKWGEGGPPAFGRKPSSFCFVEKWEGVPAAISPQRKMLRLAGRASSRFHAKQARLFATKSTPRIVRSPAEATARRPARLVLAIRNSGACHAQKCKAGIAVGYGFIFAVDFSRLFAVRWRTAANTLVNRMPYGKESL